jgi:hypothetical protein
MQDEILKHTKKAYSAMKNSEHSFWHKTKEVLIEIFIIVFAVSLSIYLHSWSEHNHQQKEVSEFLIDLKSDLQQDIKAMKEEAENLKTGIKSIDYLSKLSPKEIEKMGTIKANFHLTTRRTNEGNFEGFKSSGKIGYIEDKKLKSNILEYFVQNMPPLYKIEENRNIKSIELLEEISNSESLAQVLSEKKVKTIMTLNSQYSQTLVNAYKSDIELAEQIIKQIDREVQK